MGKPSNSEIENEFFNSVDKPDICPGMTYSEGVQAALDWVLGNTETPPTCDE